jgi:hypothetical protein
MFRHWSSAIHDSLQRADEAVPDASQYADRLCAKCGEQADYRLTGGGGGMMRPRSISDSCRDHRNTDEHAGMHVYQSYTRPMNDVPQIQARTGWSASKYSWES